MGVFNRIFDVFWMDPGYQGGGGGEGEHVRGQGEDDTPEGWTFF